MSLEPPPRLRRCGDAGVLLEVGDNDRVHQWTAAIVEAALPGVIDVVPGLATVLIRTEPGALDQSALEQHLRLLRPAPPVTAQAEVVRLPVTYDGADLAEVGRLTGLSTAEVVQAHVGSPWRVAFCGFAPGFAYLVGGNPRLWVPRRAEPRVRVPVGAVALAGDFSAVYPRQSPGGWQLIGHTEESLWDLAAKPPARLAPGMRVQFVET